MKLLSKGLALCSLLLASPSLFAAAYIGGSGKIWELPAFGNAYVVSEMLNGISLLATDGTYRTILVTISLLGIVMLAAAGIVDTGKMLLSSVKYIIGVYFLLFVLGIGASGASNRLLVNVAVYDVIDPSQRIVVQDVPGFIAWPQVFIYSIGHTVTTILEKNMGGPDYVGLTKGSPFNLGAQLMKDVQKVEITEPALKASLAEYTGNCVMPMIANGQLDLDTLIKAPDVFKAMRVDNDVLSTPVYTGTTQDILSCRDAFVQLSARLTTLYSAANLDSHVRSMTGMMSTPIGAPLAAVANQSLVYTTGQTGFSMQDAIKQSAMAKVLDSGLVLGAASYNSDSIMQSTQIELAHQSQLSAWNSGLAIFSRTMGYMFSVLQAFLIASFPILIITFLVPGMGLKMLANVIQILIWMAMWEPMLATISFITSAYLHQEVQGIITTSGDPFLALKSMGVVSKRAETLVSAAGFLATSMPMLTWGMVKGTFAFTEFIAHGVGSQFANTAGTGMATGNLSMNNVSSDTRSANKNSVAFSGDGNLGSIASSVDLTPGAIGSTGVQDGAKGVAAMRATQIAQQTQRATAVANEARQQESASNMVKEDKSKSLNNAVSTAVQSMTSTGKGEQYSNSWSASHKGGQTYNQSVQDSVREATETAAKTSESVNSTLMFQTAAQLAKKNGKITELAGVAASIGASSSMIAQAKRDAGITEGSSESQAFDKAFSALTSSGDDASRGHGATKSGSNTQSTTGSRSVSQNETIAAVKAATEDYGKSVAASRSASASRMEAESALSSLSVNIAQTKDFGQATVAQNEVKQRQAQDNQQLNSDRSNTLDAVGHKLDSAKHLEKDVHAATDKKLAHAGSSTPEVRTGADGQAVRTHVGGNMLETEQSIVKTDPTKQNQMDNAANNRTSAKDKKEEAQDKVDTVTTVVQVEGAVIAAGAAGASVSPL